MTIVLTDDWHKGTMARAIPGAHYVKGKGWCLDEAEPRSAAIALRLFPTLANAYPELVAARQELLRDVRPFDLATEWVKASGAVLDAPRVRARVADQWACQKCTFLHDVGAQGELIHLLCPRDPSHGELVQWQLQKFQEIDLAFGEACLRQHRAFYMGWERGLGKTLGTCLLIDALDIQRTTVVAPNSAKDSVWRRELARFCPWLEVVVLGNSPTKRARALDRAADLAAAGSPYVLVIHYEALALLAGKKRIERDDGKASTRIGKGWDKLPKAQLLVTDEDHRLNNLATQMAKAVKKVPHEMLLPLSGSIVQHHLEELYSPHHRAFPTRYKSKWRDWNDRFLDFAEGGYGKVCLGVRDDAIPTLQREMGAWMVYRRKEDELDLPPKRYVERRLPLTPQQRKAYEQLRDECMTVLDSGQVVAAQEGIAMLGKLRQIATGLELVGGREWAHSNKLDAAVEDITDAADDDFVVFSWYKAGVTSLKARLESKGVECFAVTGDTPYGERDDLIARFQKGEGRVFIGTLSTLGESVNLQRANQVIRLDRSFNPMLNVQAEDRVFRQGQRRNVTITDYISEGTVDELVVLPNLATKLALRAAILGGA